MLAQFTLALLIFISCWGLSMGILILVAKTVNPFLNRLLGLTIVIMAWPYIQTTLIANETILQFPCLYGAFAFFYYLTPPITYFYLRALLFDETKFYRTDWLHLIPAFLQLAFSLPFLFKGFEHQIPFAQELVNQVSVTNLTSITIVPQPLALFFVFIQTAIYIYYAFKLIQTRKKQTNTNQTHQFLILSWAKSFLYYFVAIAIFMFLNAARIHLDIKFFDFIPFGGPLFYLRSILYSLILIGIFKNPEVLYGLPNFNRNIIETRNGQQKVQYNPAFVAEEYYLPNTNLTPEQLQEYSVILTEFMQSGLKPYTQHNFNIKDLSMGSGIPQHHIAFYFRYHSPESFVDYRNRHRLNEAIRKIQNGDYKKKTLEGIGQESGFASRITFFNVFKKHTGMSATEYIEKLNRGEIQAHSVDSPF